MLKLNSSFQQDKFTFSLFPKLHTTEVRRVSLTDPKLHITEVRRVSLADPKLHITEVRRVSLADPKRPPTYYIKILYAQNAEIPPLFACFKTIPYTAFKAENIKHNVTNLKDVQRKHVADKAYKVKFYGSITKG